MSAGSSNPKLMFYDAELEASLNQLLETAEKAGNEEICEQVTRIKFLVHRIKDLRQEKEQA